MVSSFADKNHPLFYPRETRHPFEGNHVVCPISYETNDTNSPVVIGP